MSRMAGALCRFALVAVALASLPAAAASAQSIREAIERETQAIEPRMIAWRRDIHSFQSWQPNCNGECL